MPALLFFLSCRFLYDGFGRSVQVPTLTKSDLSKREKLLWYLKPLRFGFLLGLAYAVLQASLVASQWDYFSERYQYGLKYETLPEIGKLYFQGACLAFASTLLNSGLETVLRTSIIFGFLAFALNQLDGSKRWVREALLNYSFGKRHYTFEGFLSSDLTKWLMTVSFLALFILLVQWSLLSYYEVHKP